MFFARYLGNVVLAGGAQIRLVELEGKHVAGRRGGGGILCIWCSVCAALRAGMRACIIISSGWQARHIRRRAGHCEKQCVQRCKCLHAAASSGR